MAADGGEGSAGGEEGGTTALFFAFVEKVLVIDLSKHLPHTSHQRLLNLSLHNLALDCIDEMRKWMESTGILDDRKNDGLWQAS